MSRVDAGDESTPDQSAPVRTVRVPRRQYYLLVALLSVLVGINLYALVAAQARHRRLGGDEAAGLIRVEGQVGGVKVLRPERIQLRSGQDLLEALRSLDPKSSGFQVMGGVATLKSDPARSRAFFTRCLKMDPDHAQCLEGLVFLDKLKDAEP